MALKPLEDKASTKTRPHTQISMLFQLGLKNEKKKKTDRTQTQTVWGQTECGVNSLDLTTA